MKTGNKQLYRTLGVCLLLATAFAACTAESEIESRKDSQAKEVTLDIPFALAKMETTAMTPATRVQAGETMEVTYGEDADAATTRTTEEEIKQLWLLQFDGTGAAAALSQCVNLTALIPNMSTGTGTLKVKLKATGSGNAIQTVCLVANLDLSANKPATVGGLSSFVAAFAPQATVPTGGLPMYAGNIFDPMSITEAPRFTLKRMVTKMTYNYKMDKSLANYLKEDFTVTVRQIANGTVYAEPASTTGANSGTNLERKGILTMPGKLTVNAAADATLTGTFYIAENIAGQTSGLTSEWQRGLTRSKANATYLELTGKDKAGKPVSYVLYPGDPNKVNDFNVLRNHAYTLNINIVGVYVGDERLTMQQNLSRKADGAAATANCYIVTRSNGKYYFDATKQGNYSTISGIGQGLPVLSTATTARVLWQTGSTTAVVKEVSYANGEISFTTGAAAEGNAVIGLFASSAANAPCLWSWHVWKLNGSEPYAVDCTKIPASSATPSDFKMMDRNLGAYNNTPGNIGSIGLLYQWGRKDPFPGAEGFNAGEPNNIYGSYNKGGTVGNWNGKYEIQTIPMATGGTEVWAVQYPTIFILTEKNWIITSNDKLWGTSWDATSLTGSYNKNNGTKSAYDPCPIGYRVPPADTWSKEHLKGGAIGEGVSRDNGITLNKMTSDFWFPATRMRYRSNGQLVAASQGFYWSSSPFNSDNAYTETLSFNGKEVRTNGIEQGNCQSVRCVVE